MSVQAAATFLSEGVRHLAHALLRFISENDFDWILSSGVVRIFKIGIFVIAIALLAFHPILNIVLRCIRFIIFLHCAFIFDGLTNSASFH